MLCFRLTYIPLFQSSVVTIYNEPGSSLVLINSTASSDEGVYSCVASNGVGDPAIMETELVISRCYLVWGVCEGLGCVGGV